MRSLTEGDWKRLYQAWLDRHVLIVRGQKLSKPDFISYSRRFGRLKPHRVKSTRDPEHPEVTLMGVTTGNSANDKLVLDRGQGWHTDGPWDVEICKATQLYALEIPSYGGDTLFASMHAAYDALPDQLKTRIAPLKVEFGYGGRARKGIERLDPEDQKAPPAVYDMVRVHPETGRKSLYVNPTHIIRIVGMPEAEGIGCSPSFTGTCCNPTRNTGTNGRLATSLYGTIGAQCIRPLAVTHRASGASIGARP